MKFGDQELRQIPAHLPAHLSLEKSTKTHTSVTPGDNLCVYDPETSVCFWLGHFEASISYSSVLVTVIVVKETIVPATAIIHIIKMRLKAIYTC